MRRLKGRKAETNLLWECCNSRKSQFIALYGRHGVGKTYLIRRFFEDRFYFRVTGVAGGSYKVELEEFVKALFKHDCKVSKPRNWHEAFLLLGNLTAAWCDSPNRPVVVFIDEAQCFDTQKSGFLTELAYYWRQWVSRLENVCLVVSASDPSFFMRKFIEKDADEGESGRSDGIEDAGLSRFVTCMIHLRPFTLRQTAAYLKDRKFGWQKSSVLQAYMVFGGIPQYLSLFDASKNAAENVRDLCFGPDGSFRGEFQRLFEPFRPNQRSYMKIVQILAAHPEGLTRIELAKELRCSCGRILRGKLWNLEYCDFVRRVSNCGLANNDIYVLNDPFCLFYCNFLAEGAASEWSDVQDRDRWSEAVFRQVCIGHSERIFRALQMEEAEPCLLRSIDSEGVAQADLIGFRGDGTAVLIVSKYADRKYSVGRGVFWDTELKIAEFRARRRYWKPFQVVWVSSKKPGSVRSPEFFSNILSLKELFG